MAQRLFQIALGAMTLACVNGAFGPALSTGPTASGAYIQEAISTLTLPDVSSSEAGDLSLWVGMGTSGGDLIQTISNWVDGQGTWNFFAYTLKETSSDSQEQIFGPIVTAYPGDQVTSHYVYDSSTGNYTQYAAINGNVVSTLSTSDGFAEGFGSAVECAATNCGTVPAHSWSNTQIIMNVADPTYNQTLGKSSGVTGGDMSTSDGGVTWTISTFNIPEFTFTD